MFGSSVAKQKIETLSERVLMDFKDIVCRSQLARMVTKREGGNRKTSQMGLRTPIMGFPSHASKRGPPSRARRYFASI